ncbi:MAG TPA: hypothetical protein VJJ27_01255 [Candidatus Paceibacterota bacterium]
MTAFLTKVNAVILNPLITFGFAVALLLFLWGLFEFIRNPADAENRKKGQNNIIWGLVGLLIMFSVFGIIKVILGTFGLPQPGFPFTR